MIYDGAPSQRLQGITLPGIERFTIALPHGADDVVGSDISVKHIYVGAETRRGRYDVWSTSASTLSSAGG